MPRRPSRPEKYITQSTLARRWGMHRSTIARRIAAKMYPYIKEAGGKKLIPLKWVEDVEAEVYA